MTDSGAKSEAKPETKSEAKDTSESDTGAGKEADGSASDTPSSYSRGENQKAVTDAYRNNWDEVFGKKKRRTSKK